MKKLLLLTAFILLISSFGANAQDFLYSGLSQGTRTLTMGDNWDILMDESNIWFYPNRINNYPDLLVGELGYNSYYDRVSKADGAYDYYQAIQRLGVNWKFGGDNPWVLGTYFHNHIPEFSEFIPSSALSEGIYYDGNKRIDLFYGRNLGETPFGVHVGYTQSSWKEDDPENMDENAYSQIDVSAGLGLMQGKLDVAAGAKFISFTDKYTVSYLTGTLPDTATVFESVDDYKPDGNMMLYGMGRYFYEYSPTYTFVPHVEVYTGSFKSQEYDWMGEARGNELDRSMKTTLFAFDLGCGMHYTPATNVLAVINVGFTYISVKDELTVETTGGTNYSDTVRVWEDKYKYMMLPYFKVGFEADVFKWMDVRFGATSYWTKETNEYQNTGDLPYYTYKDIYNWPQNQTYLGFGFHWNRLHIDTYTDPRLFLHGFDFITGKDYGYYDGPSEDDHDHMNFQMTVVYEMF